MLVTVGSCAQPQARKGRGRAGVIRSMKEEVLAALNEIEVLQLSVKRRM